MIRGETVYVSLLTTGEADRLNNPERTYAEPVAVDNVVVVPATANDQSVQRPDGITVTYTLHFPRGYSSALRGAKVTVRGDEFYVSGSPAPYTESNVRGAWTMPVEVGRHDG